MDSKDDSGESVEAMREGILERMLRDDIPVHVRDQVAEMDDERLKAFCNEYRLCRVNLYWAFATSILGGHWISIKQTRATIVYWIALGLAAWLSRYILIIPISMLAVSLPRLPFKVRDVNWVRAVKAINYPKG